MQRERRVKSDWHSRLRRNCANHCLPTEVADHWTWLIGSFRLSGFILLTPTDTGSQVSTFRPGTSSKQTWKETSRRHPHRQRCPRIAVLSFGVAPHRHASGSNDAPSRSADGLATASILVPELLRWHKRSKSSGENCAAFRLGIPSRGPAWETRRRGVSLPHAARC